MAGTDNTKQPVAVVTGASRGIGKSIALRLAAEGCAVACVARTLGDGDSHLDGSLEQTVAQITEAGGIAIPIVADLSAIDLDAAGIVAPAIEAFGPVDYLVNNAAAAYYTPYTEISAKRIDIAYRVNVRTPWLLAQAVLPAMIERGSGSVLNISSGSARHPDGPPFVLGQTGGATAYGGSKAFLDRATTGAAAELFGTGVSLNCLTPEAAVATPGANARVDLDATGHIIEPMETMVEAAWVLLSGDPSVLTGRVAYSLSLLYELDLPVHDLAGADLVEGWQPADFPVDRLKFSNVHERGKA